MTLIEVTAALALLGSLAVALLLVRARTVRQDALAARRLSAVAAADALLSDWREKDLRIPCPSQGDAPGGQDLAWRTHTVTATDAGGDGNLDELGLRVVRLEVLDRRNASADGIDDIPLVTADVVVQKEVRPLEPTR
jgi:hypothetical protein